MRRSIAAISGYSEDDPAIVGEHEDFSTYLDYTDALVRERHRIGLSQADVAGRMGTTQSAVSDLERSGADPRVSTLMRYARALGIPLRFRTPTVNLVPRTVSPSTVDPGSAPPLSVSGWQTAIPRAS